MGKYEHIESDLAELSLTKLLNNEPADIEIKKLQETNPECDKAFYMATHQIQNEIGYTDVYAKNMGNYVQAIGDIEIYKKTNLNYLDYTVEVKYTTGKSTGTLRNTSPNILQKSKVFGDNLIAWGKYLDQKPIPECENMAWYDFVKKTMKIYSSRPFNKKTDIYNFARESRENIHLEPMKEKIIEYSKYSKTSYIDYLNQQNKSAVQIKRLYTSVVNGTCKNKKNKFDKDEMVNDKMLMTYISKNTGTSSIKKFSIPNGCYDIKPCNDNGYGMTISCNQQPLLRFCLNYKNVYQGIQTPSINFFDVT